MDLEIDAELLIRLVEGSQCIWDKSLTEYKSRTCTTAAWRAVCDRLNPQFAQFTEIDKAAYTKRVVNKWRNVKDQWLKRCRQVASNKKTKRGKKPVKHYYYHDQLSFLLKCTDVNEIESGCEDDDDRSWSPVVFNYTPEIPQTSKKRPPPAEAEAENKKTKTETEDRILFTPMPVDEDPMVLFFKGILPSMRDFSEEETLEFQSGVLSMVQNIKRSRAYHLTSPEKWALPDPSQPSACHLRSSQRLANVVKPEVSDSFS